MNMSIYAFNTRWANISANEKSQNREYSELHGISLLVLSNTSPINEYRINPPRSGHGVERNVFQFKNAEFIKSHTLLIYVHT